MNYGISVGGDKSHGLKDWVSGTSKGLFGGMWADIKNIQIRYNGQPYFRLGNWIDKEKWKKRLRMGSVDKDRVVNVVKKELDDKFNNNDADVRCLGKDPLKVYLNRKGKMTPVI